MIFLKQYVLFLTNCMALDNTVYLFTINININTQCPGQYSAQRSDSFHMMSSVKRENVVFLCFQCHVQENTMFSKASLCLKDFPKTVLMRHCGKTAPRLHEWLKLRSEIIWNYKLGWNEKCHNFTISSDWISSINKCYHRLVKEWQFGLRIVLTLTPTPSS